VLKQGQIPSALRLPVKPRDLTKRKMPVISSSVIFLKGRRMLGRLRMRQSPSIVPDAFSRDVYLVLDNLGGRLHRALLALANTWTATPPAALAGQSASKRATSRRDRKTPDKIAEMAAKNGLPAC
jgi:hypothetical protein